MAQRTSSQLGKRPVASIRRFAVSATSKRSTVQAAASITTGFDPYIAPGPAVAAACPVGETPYGFVETADTPLTTKQEQHERARRRNGLVEIQRQFCSCDGVLQRDLRVTEVPQDKDTSYAQRRLPLVDGSRAGGSALAVYARVLARRRRDGEPYTLCVDPVLGVELARDPALRRRVEDEQLGRPFTEPELELLRSRQRVGDETMDGWRRDTAACIDEQAQAVVLQADAASPNTDINQIYQYLARQRSTDGTVAYALDTFSDAHAALRASTDRFALVGQELVARAVVADARWRAAERSAQGVLWRYGYERDTAAAEALLPIDTTSVGQVLHRAPDLPRTRREPFVRPLPPLPDSTDEGTEARRARADVERARDDALGRLTLRDNWVAMQVVLAFRQAGIAPTVRAAIARAGPNKVRVQSTSGRQRLGDWFTGTDLGEMTAEGVDATAELDRALAIWREVDARYDVQESTRWLASLDDALKVAPEQLALHRDLTFSREARYAADRALAKAAAAYHRVAREIDAVVVREMQKLRAALAEYDVASQISRDASSRPHIRRLAQSIAREPLIAGVWPMRAPLYESPTVADSEAEPSRDSRRDFEVKDVFDYHSASLAQPLGQLRAQARRLLAEYAEQLYPTDPKTQHLESAQKRGVPPYVYTVERFVKEALAQPHHYTEYVLPIGREPISIELWMGILAAAVDRGLITRRQLQLADLTHQLRIDYIPSALLPLLPPYLAPDARLLDELIRARQFGPSQDEVRAAIISAEIESPLLVVEKIKRGVAKFLITGEYPTAADIAAEAVQADIRSRGVAGETY